MSGTTLRADSGAHEAAVPDTAPTGARPRAAARRVVAVIGGGKISEQHLKVLARRSDVTLAAVCDLSPALARFTAERAGVARHYTDHRTMLREVPCDVVHVLTPPATHDAIARECLAAGCDVVVEKPVALSQAAFRDLWRFAQAHGRRLTENHNYRFNPPILRLEQVLREGRLGDVQEIEVRMNLPIRAGGRYADAHLPHASHRLPAGVLHEFVTHLAYLFLHFVPGGGDAIERVHALWHNHGGGALFRVDDLDATLVAGAVHGRIRFSAGQWPDVLSVQLRGSRGWATAELFQPAFAMRAQRGGGHFAPVLDGLAGGWAQATGGIAALWGKVRGRGAYDGLERFLQLTYDALDSGAPLPVDHDRMDAAARLVDRLLEGRAA